MRWFTADLHFDHKNIIRYCGRPFKDVKHMNHCLVENWNRVVGDDDTVYIIGDLGYNFLNPVQLAVRMSKLNGAKRLVLGNHDKLYWRDYIQYGFEWAGSSDTVKIGDYWYWLAHYPSDIPPMGRGLCGHVHSRGKWIGNDTLNVGVDVNGFAPLSENEIDEMFNTHLGDILP